MPSAAIIILLKEVAKTSACLSFLCALVRIALSQKTSSVNSSAGQIYDGCINFVETKDYFSQRLTQTRVTDYTINGRKRKANMLYNPEIIRY
ncbi:hypothetical protein T11_7011 [Trichinella zimbabwensis]|uniref:Uncharacterized protein n=1 Tax=Trichinella zimbabwensis TaxID=268475 RepID=A0A0V1H4J5_9BILA|nr:hypothetical protein T11_7011 [Trichinella zimbabwensis]